LNLEPLLSPIPTLPNSNFLITFRLTSLARVPLKKEVHNENQKSQSAYPGLFSALYEWLHLTSN
jgi:hypothetical protein